ncbi:MAG: NAD(P)H-binding protein [Candidatus Nanopelagicales bacterium]|nr:NAD(P)H-binding protein [Candidatus Nanopelagicales bacterium]
MTIAVIGGTGRTGAPLVDELLRRGHELRVLARSPEKLGAVTQRVHVVPGSSTEPAALGQLLDGADAVVSALGPTKQEPDLHSRTAELLIPAMRERGITRFVGISGAGMDVPGDQKGGRDRAISFLIQRLGGAIVADKPREYRAFADSDLAFTLVRPPRLVDGAATGRVVHDAHVPGRSSSIRRADLAAFLADVVEQGLYPRQAPFVSGA